MAKAGKGGFASGLDDLPFDAVLCYGTNLAKRVADGSILTIGGDMRGGQRTVRAQDCKLDRYHNKGQISNEQYRAGMRLRDLWRRAAISFRVTSLYDERSGRRSEGAGGDAARLDSSYDARVHIDRVLERSGLARRAENGEKIKLTREQVTINPVHGPLRITASGWVAIDVCGFDEWAGSADRMMMLRAALRSLATYWRIKDDA